MYDPRAHGARCDACPLCGASEVVPPEGSGASWFVVAGEAPGEHEVKALRPFVGPSGQELDRALRIIGIKRTEAWITNVCLCRPPDNKMERVLARVDKKNRALREQNDLRKKAGLEPLPLIPTPADCCAPRLWDEVQRFRFLLPMGNHAVRALLGDVSPASLRGALLDGWMLWQPAAGTYGRARYLQREHPDDAAPEGGVPAKCVPTIHPAFALRKQRWIRPFRADVARSIRWFRGRSEWREPTIHYNPDPAVLRAFLARVGHGAAFDLETDGIESLSAHIDCMAVGTGDEVAVVGFRSREQANRGQPIHPPALEQEYRNILTEWLEDPNRAKVGHNSGYYDTCVLRAQWGVTPYPQLDTILLHRLVESEMPHNLGFVASLYTDAPAWKTDREGNKRATESESNAALWKYNALDTAITARVFAPLAEATRLRGQDHLIPYDHLIQQVCVGMHEIGLHVDQDVRMAHERRLIAEAIEDRDVLRGIAGDTAFNPGSTQQLVRLMFDVWHLDPPVKDEEIRYTSRGEPSTSDDVVRPLLSLSDRKLGDGDERTGAARRTFLLRLRHYRKVMKLLGTYVCKLRPMEQVYVDQGWDDDAEDEAESVGAFRREREYEKRGIVWPDGRVRPGWNAHTVVSGRLSSSKPTNAQNWPLKYRDMVTPAPGHVLVGIDADQLELRIAASRWQIRMYLHAVEIGADPHACTADACFPLSSQDPALRFRTMPGFPEGEWIEEGGIGFFVRKGGDWGGAAERTRTLSKRVQFNGQYGGGIETMLNVLQEAEDDEGNLTYLMLTLPEVRRMRENWLARAPEYVAGWETDLQFYRDHHHIAEPVLGRRRDFLDGEDESHNEILNFATQAAAASLINRATIKVVQEIPFGRWGPGTGLVAQVHDALYVECPISEAEYVARVLKDAMTQSDPGLPGIVFTGKPKIGMKDGKALSWRF